MVALINETNVECRVLLNLLKQKIEEFITDNKAICISVESSFLNCLNTIYVEEYEIHEDRIYLSGNHFEYNIILDDKMQLKYNDVYDECCTIIHNDTEIGLYF